MNVPSVPVFLQNFLNIVNAIGRGIGNAATHETGHYLEQQRDNGNPGLPLIDCGTNFNNRSKMGAGHACDKDPNGWIDNFVYEFYNADGLPQDPKDSSSGGGQFFYIQVPGEPGIHWGPSDKCWIDKWVHPNCQSCPCTK